MRGAVRGYMHSPIVTRHVLVLLLELWLLAQRRGERCPFGQPVGSRQGLSLPWEQGWRCGAAGPGNVALGWLSPWGARAGYQGLLDCLVMSLPSWASQRHSWSLSSCLSQQSGCEGKGDVECERSLSSTVPGRGHYRTTVVRLNLAGRNGRKWIETESLTVV